MPEKKLYSILKYGLYLWVFSALTATPVFTAEESEILLTQEQEQKAAKIDSALSYYHEQGIFNGTVLVAEAGKVIYQKGFGCIFRRSQDSDARLFNRDIDPGYLRSKGDASK